MALVRGLYGLLVRTFIFLAAAPGVGKSTVAVVRGGNPQCGLGRSEMWADRLSRFADLPLFRTVS
jgi:hypothetical protein